MRRGWGALLMVGGLVVLDGCGDDDDERFSKTVTLGGQRVEGEVLRRGQFVYMQRCASCHGRAGKGQGRRAAAAQEPPRDLTLGYYKYTGVQGDALPRDAYFDRLLERGVRGSIMKPVRGLEESEQQALVAYVKYLSPRWHEERPGESVDVPDDPWGGASEQARERGRRLYLGRAACWQCHPAYASRDRIEAIRDAIDDPPDVSFRDDLDQPTETPSHYGRALRATAFRKQTLGGGERPRDIYRAIAAGIGGSRMAGLAGELSARELWALTHYVHQLVQ